MRFIGRRTALLAPAIALAGGALAAVPASAATTTTSCSDWKTAGVYYLQSCIDVTDTQVHTYGFISSAGPAPASDASVTITGRLGDWGTRLGYQNTPAHIDNDTVRVEGATATAAPGTRVHSTVFLPGVLGTGTLVAPDNGYYYDPDVPTGPAGPTGQPSHLLQITVWASVS